MPLGLELSCGPGARSLLQRRRRTAGHRQKLGASARCFLRRSSATDLRQTPPARGSCRRAPEGTILPGSSSAGSGGGSQGRGLRSQPRPGPGMEMLFWAENTHHHTTTPPPQGTARGPSPGVDLHRPPATGTTDVRRPSQPLRPPNHARPGAGPRAPPGCHEQDPTPTHGPAGRGAHARAWSGARGRRLRAHGLPCPHGHARRGRAPSRAGTPTPPPAGHAPTRAPTQGTGTRTLPLRRELPPALPRRARARTGTRTLPPAGCGAAVPVRGAAAAAAGAAAAAAAAAPRAAPGAAPGAAARRGRPCPGHAGAAARRAGPGRAYRRAVSQRGRGGSRMRLPAPPPPTPAPAPGATRRPTPQPRGQRQRAAAGRSPGQPGVPRPRRFPDPFA